jgi:hypothetical protein
MYTDSPDTLLLFKVLCPQPVTGLIIGKKGCIINQMSQNSGSRIRLSQNTEFYPGTNDRILLGKFFVPSLPFLFLNFVFQLLEPEIVLTWHYMSL